MKKLNYFLTFAAGAMMLASCSNDKEVVAPTDDNAVQQIVLQVASNGDGLTTRAGRELLSNEAAQEIDKVDLYIVSTTDKKVKYTKSIDWSETNQEVNPYDYGKMTTITLKGNDLLANDSYKIYAIGYSNGTEYTNIPTLTKGVDASGLDNCILNYTSSTSKAEEIFAGDKLLTIENGNFSETIVLNRQVAGAYFYVYRLPMLEGLDNSCKIQLAASDFNNQLVLGGFNSFDLTGNGTGNGANVKYVVNGTKSENTTSDLVVCEALISDWYSDIKEAEETKTVNDEETKVKTGIVDTQYWIGTKEANETSTIKNRKGGYVKGSIFASSFLIPFKKVNNQTLKLQIVKGTEVLHSWNVNLPTDKIPDSSISYFVDSTSAFASDATEETKSKYSIVRNHLYCIGAKAKETPNTDPTNPTDPDPTNPDPDPTNPEEPQDISQIQDITLKVNHNWEVIHRMELE